MTTSETPPVADASAEAKKSARWEAEERQLRQHEREQARRWRVLYQRPASVLTASIALTALSGFALASAPFLAVYEQMHGPFGLFGRPMVLPFVLFGLVFLPIGVAIGQARNWGRWLAVLIGAGVVAFYAYPTPSLSLIAPAICWFFLLFLLFNRPARHFFR